MSGIDNNDNNCPTTGCANYRPNNSLSGYFKQNFGRMLELIVIVVAVFVTMQSNIQVQGDILRNVVIQQKEQAELIQSLTLTVSNLATKVEANIASIGDDSDNTEADISEIKERVRALETQVAKLETICDRCSGTN